VHDDILRSIKAEMLRDAAAEFRRTAAAGENPQLNIAAACMLEQRAERIVAGEDDHSILPIDSSVKPNPADLASGEPESRAG
jgi:hypothetical protein